MHQIVPFLEVHYLAFYAVFGHWTIKNRLAMELFMQFLAPVHLKTDWLWMLFMRFLAPVQLKTDWLRSFLYSFWPLFN